MRIFVFVFVSFFFFKQKTAYEMRISDWSSDVCSSDLDHGVTSLAPADSWQDALGTASSESGGGTAMVVLPLDHGFASDAISLLTEQDILGERLVRRQKRRKSADAFLAELATLSVGDMVVRSEEHTSELQSLMRISY